MKDKNASLVSVKIKTDEYDKVRVKAEKDRRSIRMTMSILIEKGLEDENTL